MSWSHILGHERLVDSFRQIVARQRLAQAYLFVGPGGIGKRMFARELAKALLCEAPGRAPSALNACDQCDACRLVDAGTHPDLFMVRRPEEANEFPIAVMQELCRSFSLKSARDHGKIAVLEDADDLNEESANCFLKTLEEPPPRSVFILVGGSPDRQLATILSRCQMVRFAPLAPDLVRIILQRHELQDQALLDRLIPLAAGSPGQAIELAEEALWDFRRRLLAGLARAPVDAFGLGREFIAFAEEAGKEGALQRRRAALAIRLLLEALSDALRLALGGEPRSGDSSDMPLLAFLAQHAGPEKIIAALERCLETEAQLGRYVQLALVLEGLMDSLAALLDKASSLAARARS
jgi:DNA polymerase-3 subunit delta'